MNFQYNGSIDESPPCKFYDQHDSPEYLRVEKKDSITDEISNLISQIQGEQNLKICHYIYEEYSRINSKNKQLRTDYDRNVREYRELLSQC